MNIYLDFEKPIESLDSRILELKSLNESIGFSYDVTMGYDMKYTRPEFAFTAGAKRISRAFEGVYREKTGIFSNLIQNPPFSTNKAAARYFMQNVIKDANALLQE